MLLNNGLAPICYLSVKATKPITNTLAVIMKTKKSIFILFIILSQTLFGQITYEPVFINQCTNKVDYNLLWYLTNADSSFEEANFDTKSITVPKSDVYTLHVMYDNYFIQMRTINLTDNVNIKDTIFIKRIQLEAIESIVPHASTPYSYYLDCGRPANGKIIDLYENGTIRAKGLFKKGQPIDTLLEYHRNGRLAAQLIPGKELKRVSYYDDGQLESEYYRQKRFEKEYYSNGQLKREERWSKKLDIKLKEYFEDGQVSLMENKKQQKRFDKKGRLTDKLQRIKEIPMRNNIEKFYSYQWDSFDENDKIKRRILFSYTGYPRTIEQIDVFWLREIVFYKNGTESEKIEVHSVRENNGSVRKLFFFNKIDEKWIQKKKTTANNVYEIIAAY